MHPYSYAFQCRHGREGIEPAKYSVGRCSKLLCFGLPQTRCTGNWNWTVDVLYCQLQRVAFLQLGGVEGVFPPGDCADGHALRDDAVVLQPASSASRSTNALAVMYVAPASAEQHVRRQLAPYQTCSPTVDNHGRGGVL